MTLEQHQKEVKKLNDLESDLGYLIADTFSQPLMDKFIEWQKQRSVCNKGYFDYLKSLKVKEES